MPGFAFLASITAVFSGAQLFALGIIGEYLARVHFRTLNRPPYTVAAELDAGRAMTPDRQDDPIVEVLPFDTGWWGCTTARIAGSPDLDAAGLTAVDRECRRLDVGLLYYLCPGDSMASALLAQRAGYRFVDVRTTLARAIAVETPPAPTGVRPAGPDDVARLGAIASTSHRSTRFHNDPVLDGERCDDLYRHWIEQDVLDPSTTVIVDDEPSGANGYISAAVIDGVGHIRLFAVDPSRRGHGVGGRLLDGALQWFAPPRARARRRS